jgi:hypothetical protein
MKCTECDETISGRPLRLVHGSDRVSCCSFECLITYAVGRVRQRIERQTRRWRVLALAGQKSKCRGVRSGPSASQIRKAPSPVPCARV